MKLLFIGGTIFLGPHLVANALARGHEVTLFNRGLHNPGLFPDLKKVRGDRDGGLEPLKSETWDAVIDTCGYYPRVVRQSARLLAGRVERYVFVSSVSGYLDFSQPGIDESAPVGHLSREEAEKADRITEENYGPLKVMCEREVEAALPGRSLVVRPGLIVGPYDPTDRLTYWPVRALRGGEVLVPGRPEQRVEFIDARDLAEWMIRMVEAGKTGTYNAAGPATPLTMEAFLQTCRTVAQSDATPVYMAPDFLYEQNIDPNTINTWWVADDDAQFRYIWDIDCRKAVTDGLTYRPLAETLRDTIAWDASRPADTKRRIGLEPDEERNLLEGWRNRV